MSNGIRDGAGANERPPHPATVVQPRVPHAATVAQKNARPPGIGEARLPHPATVVQPKGAGSATVAQPAVVLPAMSSPWHPPHPATVQRRASAAGAHPAKGAWTTPRGAVQRADSKEVAIRVPLVEGGAGAYTGTVEETLDDWVGRVFDDDRIRAAASAEVAGMVYNLYAYGSSNAPIGATATDVDAALGTQGVKNIESRDGFIHVENAAPSNGESTARLGVHVKPEAIATVMASLYGKFGSTLKMISSMKTPATQQAAAARLDNLVIYYNEAGHDVSRNALLGELGAMVGYFLAGHPPGLQPTGVKGVGLDEGRGSAGWQKSQIIAATYNNLKSWGTYTGIWAPWRWLRSTCSATTLDKETLRSEAKKALRKAGLF